MTDEPVPARGLVGRQPKGNGGSGLLQRLRVPGQSQEPMPGSGRRSGGRRLSARTSMQQLTTTSTGRRRSVAAAIESITASFHFSGLNANSWSATMEELWNVEGLSMSKAQLDEMKRLFYRFDTDGSNEIDASELTQVLQMLNFDVTEEQVAAIISRVDKDGNATVSFTEFVKLMSAAQERRAIDAELKMAFFLMAGEDAVFDDNGNPCSPRASTRAPLESIRNYMCGIGDRLSGEEFADMAKELPLDESGMVTFAAFRALPFWQVQGDDVGLMDGLTRSTPL
mmetsp:Transcript_10221/g.26552  ORF Transcript_10221/g.26552 Transcript_10221/m.26552 type:complete len:283 (-) Transcript_10221:59-907(-)